MKNGLNNIAVKDSFIKAENINQLISFTTWQTDSNFV